MFFGTSKGRVYLDYDDSGAYKRKVCTVLSWTMDRTTGDSEVVFVVPPMLPDVCDVVVDPYGTLPETAEEDAFIVKPPEVEMVGPLSGSSGDQITISGNYFGSKKGKVYLGYVSSKGRYTKKSCSVVSWGDDEIVFVVPRGLSAGFYDIIVSNTPGATAFKEGLKTPK
jgi:hypothetical protein